jgi:hypothetical protein
MNTLENNKLIAEFMGLGKRNFYESRIVTDTLSLDTPVHSQYILDDSLRFNSSWEWLMPVVGKCDGLSFYKRGKSDIKWGEIFNDQEVIRAFQANEIDVVYNSVVEFIKWYNENK